MKVNLITHFGIVRKRSIMRSQTVPLLFEECRIVVSRLRYVPPAITAVKDLRYPAYSVKYVQVDLPLSDQEFVISHPSAAEDLGIKVDLENDLNKKLFVM